MSYYAIHNFCRESATHLRVLNPKTTCDLKTFTVPAYEEVVTTEACKLDPTKLVRRWTTVSSDSEVFEMIFSDAPAVAKYCVFVVGNWAYVVDRAEVDSFDPDEFSNGDAMFPLNQVEEFAASLTMPFVMNALFQAVLGELQKMQPHLKRGSDPAVERETLYAPKGEKVFAWAQRMWYGCYRFGVKGSNGKTFYVVKGWLYTCCSEEFDQNVESTYESKEPFVHNCKWITDKLTTASSWWLSDNKPADKRPSNTSSGRPAWRAKDACPSGPQVTDDGFTAVPTKRTARR